MKFFIRHHPPSGLKALEAAQTLIAEYEKRNRWLESENLRLIGLAYPLTGSPKNEVTPMNHEDERRAIDLADAAGRANNNGLHALADKLTIEADRLLGGDVRRSFVEWVSARGLNPERAVPGDGFASKHTHELYECWLAAGGAPVK